MNDSTLPPSASNPKKARPRAKVGLKKGFGLHDWARLVKSANDLAQRKGQPLRKISRAEISQHNDIHDGWVSLRGKVYNLTPYLHYHPGGVDILEPCLGKDASALFDKYHRWVNIDGLIGSLLIGFLEEEKARKHDDRLSRTIIPPQQRPVQAATPDDNIEFAVPAPRPPKAVPSLLPNANGDDEADDLNPWEGKQM